MTDATCVAPGCSGPVAVKKSRLCLRHYNRKMIYGDLAVEPLEKSCAVCGALIVRTKRSGPLPKYCSETCRAEGSPRVDAEKYKRAEREKRRALREASVRLCPSCGGSFTPEKSMSQRFCTKKCSAAFFRDRSGRCSERDCERPVRARGMCSMHWKRWSRKSGTAPAEEWTERRRANYHRRRALKRNLPADMIMSADVYERDGWLCGICSGVVERDALYPDPKSPSLDHIVPLSKGGHHVLSNVQLAHLDCNVRKGDRDSIAA